MNEILDKRLIYFDLDMSNKYDVIEYLAQKLLDNNNIKDLETFIKSVYEREAIGVTGIGDGLAIPHGKSETVITPGVTVARLKNPVKWESLDQKDVELVFLFAIGEGRENDINHLKILANISKRLASVSVVERLKIATDKNLFVEILRGGN